MNGLLKEIHDDARNHSIPVIKDDGMAFLLDYIRNHEGIRDILEIGTAVGYSAISMASVRWDMTVDTVEVSCMSRHVRMSERRDWKTEFTAISATGRCLKHRRSMI